MSSLSLRQSYRLSSGSGRHGEDLDLAIPPSQPRPDETFPPKDGNGSGPFVPKSFGEGTTCKLYPFQKSLSASFVESFLKQHMCLKMLSLTYNNLPSVYSTSLLHLIN